MSTNGTHAAISVRGLTRIFQSGEREVKALRGVDLEIGTGELVALMGRSGSGKTTLLNSIGGLDSPTEGAVRIYDRDLATMNEDELTAWRRTEVGFIFQAFGLLPTLSAFENVELLLRIAKKPRSMRRERALHCLDLVGLTKWADHRPHEMSGGQQQRVAIARAIANSPKILLADEPTGELDSDTAVEVLSLFRTIVKEEKMTMLVATHDRLFKDYVDKILHLVDGKIDEVVIRN